MPKAKNEKASKQKSQKPKRTRYYVFNIKLLSKERQGAQAYTDMISYLHNQKVRQDVQHDKQMILRTMFSSKTKGTNFLYGKIARFTKLDGKDWINLENFQKENVEIPKNRLPNLKETDYVFVPGAHRFAVLKNTEIGIASVLAFLNGALKAATNSNEQYEVWLEQSTDIFDEIINAKSIEKLEITVTYTNDDVVDGAEEYMDKLLKDAGIANLFLAADAGPSKNIKIDNPLLAGTLALAKSNGKVLARIVNSQDNKVTLETDEHPQEFVVDVKSDTEKTLAIANQVVKDFRDGEETR